MQPNENNFYDGLAPFIRAGDEAGARKYIVEHFHEFPDEAKEMAIMLFLDEQIETEVVEASALKKFQKEALAVLTKIEKGIKDIESSTKVSALKARIAGM